MQHTKQVGSVKIYISLSSVYHLIFFFSFTIEQYYFNGKTHTHIIYWPEKSDSFFSINFPIFLFLLACLCVCTDANIHNQTINNDQLDKTHLSISSLSFTLVHAHCPPLHQKYFPAYQQNSFRKEYKKKVLFDLFLQMYKIQTHTHIMVIQRAKNIGG